MLQNLRNLPHSATLRFNFRLLLNYLKLSFHNYTVKKVRRFPVPRWDVTNQTVPGREKLIISVQGEFGY
jgi:hypothetical protein